MTLFFRSASRFPSATSAPLRLCVYPKSPRICPTDALPEVPN